jgi:WD40 repeat protein
MWNVETGALACKPVRVHTNPILSIAFSHDGRHVVSGSYDKTICVWNAETGVIISGPFRGHTSLVLSVALSLDGTRVVSGSADETIYIWDAETGTIVAGPFKGHTNEVSFVAFFPDNKRIFSLSKSYLACLIYIWDIETGASVSWKHASSVCSLAFSLDRKHVVFGSYDNEVHIADAETATIVSGPFRGHTGSVGSVAISSDGTLVASGSHNKICIWDAETGEIVFGLLPGHTERVVSVAFSQDGKHVMSFSDDQMIRILNIERRELISTVHGTVAVLVSMPPLTSCIFFRNTLRRQFRDA